MVEPARVCAISCVVEGKLTVISARVIYRLGALCDSRGLRSPTVCYPLTASALELFPTHHTTRGRACLLPFTLAMRFVHAMWRCDMPLAEYKHGRVGTLMQCFNCSSGHNRVRQWWLPVLIFPASVCTVNSCQSGRCNSCESCWSQRCTELAAACLLPSPSSPLRCLLLVAGD